MERIDTQIADGETDQWEAEMLEFRIPSSVLLFGEYAITQYGGIGLGLVAKESTWTRIFLGGHVPPEQIVRNFSYQKPPSILDIRLDPSSLQGIAESSDKKTAQYPHSKYPIHIRSICYPGHISPERIEYMWHCCFSVCWPAIKQTYLGNPSTLTEATCLVDTRELFLSSRELNRCRDETGEGLAMTTQKKGLSSSAGACLAMCLCLWSMAQLDPFDNASGFVEIVIAAHKLFQGGGSGYDVLTSYCGTTTLMMQMDKSTTSFQKHLFDPLESENIVNDFYNLANTCEKEVSSNTWFSWMSIGDFFSLKNLFYTKSVETKNALGAFIEYSMSHSELIKAQIDRSNKTNIHLIREMHEKDGDYQTVNNLITTLITYGLEIGTCIGVTADIPGNLVNDVTNSIEKEKTANPDDELHWKSLGAGNETVGLFSYNRNLSRTIF